MSLSLLFRRFGGSALLGLVVVCGARADFVVYPDILSQQLATNPGDQYDVNFWVNNSIDSDTPTQSYFSANWGGAVSPDVVTGGQVLAGGGPPALPYIPGSAPGSDFNVNNGWVDYDFAVTATQSSTVLSFAAYNLPSWVGLDNVSVTDVSSAGGNIVQDGSFEDDIGLTFLTSGLDSGFLIPPVDFTAGPWTMTTATIGADWFVDGADAVFPAEDGLNDVLFGALGGYVANAPDQALGLPAIAALLLALLALARPRRSAEA